MSIASNFEDLKTFLLGPTSNLQSAQKSTRNGEKLNESLTTAEPTGSILSGMGRIQNPDGTSLPRCLVVRMPKTLSE